MSNGPGNPPNHADEIATLRAQLDRLRDQLDTIVRRLTQLEQSMDRAEPEPVHPPLPVPPLADPAPTPLTPPQLPPAPQPFSQPLPPPPPIDEPLPPPLPVTTHHPVDSTRWELRVGTYWLVRLGVALFVLTLVLAGNYAYENWVIAQGPWVKLLLMAMGGIGLASFGYWIAHTRQTYQTFGTVLEAGGLASVYYTLYASHHIASLRVVESPLVGGSLLLGWAGLMLGIADRSRSQTLAVLAVLLAFFATGINPVSEFTLLSNLLLVAVAVWFFLLNHWAALPLTGLLAGYGSFAWWRISGLLDRTLASGSWVETAWVRAACLGSYWLLFTWAAMAPPAKTFPESIRVAFLTLNNAAMFAGATLVLVLLGTLPFWLVAAFGGAVLAATGAWAVRQEPESGLVRDAYYAQAILLLTAALATYFDGPVLMLVLALESVFLHLMAGSTQSRMPWWGSVLTAALAVLAALFQTGGLESWQGLIAVTTAGLLLFNARSESHSDQPPPTLAAGGFSLGGVAVLLLYLGQWEWESGRVLALVLTGLVLFSTRRWHGVNALPAQAQLFFLTGLWLWAHGTWVLPTPQPWWNAAALILAAFWQAAWTRNEGWSIPPDFRGPAASLWAVGCTLVFLGWLKPSMADIPWVWTSLALSLVMLAAAFLFRMISFGICAQFLLASAVLASLHPWQGGLPAMVTALAPIAITAAMSLMTHPHWFGHRIEPSLRSLVATAGTAYRALALALGLLWVIRFIPSGWCPAVLWWLSGLLVVSCLVWKSPVRLYGGLIYALLGLLPIWLPWATVYSDSPSTPDSLGILIGVAGLLATEALLFKWGTDSWRTIRAGYFLLGILHLWWWVGWQTGTAWSQQLLTVSWTLLAALLLLAGFLARHRWYRWAGLALFGIALLRAGLVDIWRFDTGARIICLLVLSLSAIGLGFLYTKFSDHVKRWL